ncbi:unnamed protein product, partial [Meganyctiphanes norvegica]
LVDLIEDNIIITKEENEHLDEHQIKAEMSSMREKKSLDDPQSNEIEEQQMMIETPTMQEEHAFIADHSLELEFYDSIEEAMTEGDNLAEMFYDSDEERLIKE